jgi:hypothetical protein
MMMYHFKTLFFLILLLSFSFLKATQILIPMDDSQKNHLKAYGIAYWVIEKEIPVEWLLNYRGGSFVTTQTAGIEEELLIRGVSYEVIADAQYMLIQNEMANPEVNQDVVKLEKAPKVAVYSPKNKQPWDDAVTLVLAYAEIPYEIIYDEEIIRGDLPKYDWLHLHHEDFTGQYGKFWSSQKNTAWFREYVRFNEEMAHKLGYEKVSDLKLAVANNIKGFVAGGGFMFAMCAATDSYDIALAAEKTDICKEMFDGDPSDPNMQTALDYMNGFAFKDYKLEENPSTYEFSTIDATQEHSNYVRSHGPNGEQHDMFTLFDFSAKWDVIPSMLNQNHETVIKGFMGQTTAFRKEYLRSDVLVLGESKYLNSAKYIHGEFGNGTWTYYGGHDPEDHTHRVHDPATDLNLHPNSPGYRLILNNILFPAAK